MYSDEEIKNLITERLKIDQDFRFREDIDSVPLEEWDRVDTETKVLMNKIVDQVGAITISRFGEKTSENAWNLVQHCDLFPDFQKRYLKLMYENKLDFLPRNIAYLEDRIATGSGNPQVYGTQFTFNEETKKYKPFPTIDSKNVDKRRKEVGLFTMKEYAENNPEWDVSDLYPQD